MIGIFNCVYPLKKGIALSKFLFNLKDMDFTPKTLPTNLEAEQAVLAAVLFNNRALESVSEFLLPEHFSHPAHQEIYKLALRQFSTGIPFDIITVKNYLEQQGVLESVGGVEYLSKLASAGATVVNTEHYGRLIFDAARRRDLIKLGQSIIEDAYTEDLDKPVDSQIESTEQQLFNLATTGQSEQNIVSLAEALKGALQEAEIAYKADGKLSGLTTGLDALDRSISGLHHSDLIIIAGRPGMGKTTLAMNIAFNAANALYNGRANQQYKGAVVFFSLEMSHDQLGTRIFSSQSKIPATHMRDGNLTDEDFMKLSEYYNALSKLPLVIDDTADMSVPMIKTRARRIARKYGGIALIVIDYLQLMKLPGGKASDNRVQELSTITRGLKILAKELDVPVITLSQLSRGVEQRDDKRPILSDLRDSGSIEQDADIVMFTYREEYYLDGRSPDKRLSGTASENVQQHWQKRLDNSRNKADIIIAKNRHGKPETVHLSFTGEYYLFDNLDTYGMPSVPEDTSFASQYTSNDDSGNQTVVNIEDLPDDF